MVRVASLLNSGADLETVDIVCYYSHSVHGVVIIRCVIELGERGGGLNLSVCYHSSHLMEQGPLINVYSHTIPNLQDIPSWPGQKPSPGLVAQLTT